MQSYDTKLLFLSYISHFTQFWHVFGKISKTILNGSFSDIIKYVNGLTLFLKNRKSSCEL